MVIVRVCIRHLCILCILLCLLTELIHNYTQLQETMPAVTGCQRWGRWSFCEDLALFSCFLWQVGLHIMMLDFKCFVGFDFKCFVGWCGMLLLSKLLLQTQKDLAHVAIALSKDPNAAPPAVGASLLATSRRVEGSYAPPSLKGTAAVRATLRAGPYHGY